MKRIVKLTAVDKRYKGDTPYPHRCVFDEGIKTYLTGQHIDPRDPSTLGNLTLDEMIGKVPLSADKAKKFPFVINPLNRINFKNGHNFNLSLVDGQQESPQDVAYENLLRKHGWYVAHSQTQVIPRKHYFYLHDEIYEARQRVTSSDKSYKAEKYIRETLTKDGIFDLALVLNYRLQSFTFNPKEYDEILLKDKLLSVCKSNPDAILQSEDKTFKDEVFALKLSLHGIISQKGTDFYDGSEFIANNLEGFKVQIQKENRTSQVSKWNRLLAEAENRLPDTNSSSESENKRKELYDVIKDFSIEELKKFAGSKKYAKAEWDILNTKEELVKFLTDKIK